MGNTVTKAREAHAQAKSKPKNTRDVRQQKIKLASTTGVLALPNSRLKKLPDEVLQLFKLRTLDVTGNQLSELPPQISALTVLKTLKLSLNAFETLPDLSELKALTTLVLDSNVLVDIPNALPPNLTKLTLKNNQLRVIPPSVLQLTQLQELDVPDNVLETLSPHLGKMQELQELNVDGNKLTELPAFLAKCGKLKVLSARGNLLVGRSAGAKVQPIAAELLREGVAVQVMHLEGNPMTKEDLQEMDGFNEFLVRRTKLKNKEIHGGLNSDLSLCGLE